MNTNLIELRSELNEKADNEKAQLLQRFFKTGKGEYGEGDIFLGIVVPEQRKIAKKHSDLTLNDLEILLNSKIHEERMVSLFILVNNFIGAKKQKNEDLMKEIFEFYLKNTKKINNWDLVDVTCHKIIGNYLLEQKNKQDREILYNLAKSNNLWEKRIAIVSTFAFIHDNDFEDTLKISEMLLNDKHDLIHKAVGWMLREIGNKDMAVLEGFLSRYYKKMPRTMLRYSIEKFPEGKRKSYLLGNI